MKTKRLAPIGLLLVSALFCASGVQAGELYNITVGRFQDFTVVTLFGDAPMTVTHQIVEAKDGKPHRIVVDLSGVLHNLEQNNFRALPTGTIESIRTSQFAVSPEPVVRVVLDLGQPAAYRLETPGNNVRIMVSLPNDPPIGKVWSARGDDASPTVPSITPPLPEPVQLATNDPEPGAEVKVAAPADSPEGPVRARKADEPAAMPPVNPDSPSPEGDINISGPPSPGTGNKAPATRKSDAPEVPLPMPESKGSDKIEFELPKPPVFAEPVVGGSESKPAEKQIGPSPAPAPALAETSDKPAPAAKPQPAAKPEPVVAAGPQSPKTQAEPESDVSEPAPLPMSGPEPAAKPVAQADAPAPDVSEESAEETDPADGEPGSESAPLASLTTLPPLPDEAPQLVPSRTKVAYHTEGRRDPFMPLVQMGGGYNAAALPDVGSLRLVGLLHDVQQSWGLFEDANGFGYILKKGDRVKNGRLTKLTSTQAYFQLTEFGWSRSVKLDLETEG